MTAVKASSTKLRIGLLASGEGTTLQSILDACAQGRLNGEVAVVISNHHESGALRRTKAASVEAVHLSSKTHPDGDALDNAILGKLREADVDLVVLAGYMKQVGPRTLAEYGGRVLNTYPALLPKYGGKGMYGRRMYEAVLAAGDSETGVTIHQADAEYDHGPVIAQISVPVMKEDDVQTLAARVQAVERSFLVRVLQQFAERRAPNPSGANR